MPVGMLFASSGPGDSTEKNGQKNRGEQQAFHANYEIYFSIDPSNWAVEGAWSIPDIPSREARRSPV
jgi:hypothetical protein